ncbi:MAG TPA: glycoside hydrolase family 43 protein [Paenibacillus sp.]|nr:glycoside hydrolase family 43 protein [Paenibacillus sp.]
MKNGSCWLDTDGRHIQAHGGAMLEHEGMYYWYGENKDADTVGHAVPFLGFSCYSSKDMRSWKNEGLVFASERNDPESEIHSSRVGERPKVLYNRKTNRFVLWFHLDDRDYRYARIGIAVSDNPTGPFVFVRSVQPDGRDSRDMTVYLDEDGSAYCVCSTDLNRTLLISKLDDDFAGFAGEHRTACLLQFREAPVVLKENGVYYMFTSGCTGWDPNAMLYGVSGSIMGDWRLIDNPCAGPNARKTFFGQSANSFKANGQWYIMLDHWNKEDLRTSGYSFLPIRFEGGEVEVRWTEEFPGV